MTRVTDLWISMRRLRGGKKMNSFEFTLHSPITDEEWDMITDVNLDHTDNITFQTKNGKEVRFVKEGQEIIRCRDCKHHDGIRCFRWNSTIITGFDDYCSNAERRTDGEP